MKSGPLWKRKGYQSEAEYRKACAATRKTRAAALLATSASNKALHILEIMWKRAEFDRPFCTITKEQLMKDARCGLTTVKLALAELRAEGTIVPMNIKGGRSIPARYKMSVAGGAVNASDEAMENMKRERDREAAWRFLSQKFGPLKALEMMGNPEEES